MSTKKSKDHYLKIIKDWKHAWMNQTQNSKEDFENYYHRAISIDANMIHSLAERLLRDDQEWTGEQTPTHRWEQLPETSTKVNKMKVKVTQIKHIDGATIGELTGTIENFPVVGKLFELDGREWEDDRVKGKIWTEPLLKATPIEVTNTGFRTAVAEYELEVISEVANEN